MGYLDINSWYEPKKKSDLGSWWARYKRGGRNPKRRERHMLSQLKFFSKPYTRQTKYLDSKW